MLNQPRHLRPFCIGTVIILLVGSLLLACGLSPTPSPTPTPTPTSTPIPTPTPIPASYYVEQGDAALLKSDFAAAEIAYQQAIEVDPDLALAYSHMAFSYALQPERWSESLEMAEEVVDMAPDDAEAWAYLSLVRVLNYRYDRLPEAAQKAVELDEDSTLAHVALAQARLILNEVDEALAEVERALELEPQNVLALIAQAAYHSRQGEFDQALLSAGEAVDLAPDFAYARLVLAYAHMDILEYQEAREQLQKALEVNPEYLPAVLTSVRLYAAQDEMSTAWEEMQRAERLAPDVPAMLVTLGWLRLQQNAYEKALSQFQQAASLDEAYWPAYVGQGESHYGIGRCENAADDFRQVLDLFPTSGFGHLGLALSLECSDQSERAEEGYRKAAELSPHDPDVLMGVAAHTLQTGDYEEALDAYHTALIQRMDEPAIYVRLGYGHLFVMDLGAAEGNFQQALALEDDNLEALVGLGTVYNERGEYDKAVEIFEPARWNGLNFVTFRYELGVAYTMQGEYRQAINQLEEALKLGEQDPMILLYLGRAYREVKEYEDAAWAFDSFLQLNVPVLSAGYIHSMVQDLAVGKYWLTEGDALYVLRGGWQTLKSFFEDYLTLSLLSARVETVDEQRTLKMVMEVEDDEFDDDALLVGISMALGYGAAIVPRMQPLVDGGLLIVMRDAKGQELLKLSISHQVAEDLSDGLIPDAETLFQKISLQDLRRWEAGLSLDRALAKIGRTVEEDRDLSAKQEVEFHFITPEELRTHVEKQYEEEDKEQSRASQDLLVLLGLLEPGLDLEQIMIDLQSSQIVGFYDPEEDTFYVVTTGEDDEGLSAEDELTFAHEYLHALQDQHRDLSILKDEEALNDDQRLAFLAVIEGEATQVTFKYFSEHLTPLEQMVIMQWDHQAQGEAVEDAPPVIEGSQTFPYVGGLRFVETVAPGGYWPAIDDIYEDLPASTEQILHPEKYQEERDEPQTVTLPDALSQLEADWQEMDNEVMGECSTCGYLAGHVSPDLAMMAAEGWDGDRYAFFENQEDGRDLLIWKTVWDSTEEALEFVMAHRLAFGEDSEYQETLRELRGGDRTLRWEGDERCVYLRHKDETTWLVFATRLEDLDLVVPLLEEKNSG